MTILTPFLTGFLSLCNSAAEPADLRRGCLMSLCSGAAFTAAEGTVGAGSLGVDPASVQAEARNGLCLWSVLALCSALGATGIPHLNSLLSSLLFYQAQQGWCWVIKHFCHHWGLSLLFYFPWKTQLPLHHSFSELQKLQHTGNMTHPALNCTYQQAAIPCFTLGSGRNKGLRILGLTSPHYTTWWLG